MAKRWKTRTLPALVAVCVLYLCLPTSNASEVVEELRPTVLIASLVRNKAHSLPYFLHYIENLDYPKDRIALWFRSDHNEDNSSAQVEAWLDHVKPLYHSVDFEFDDSETKHGDQQTSMHWSRDRFSHVMLLRQQALDAGRQMWADYMLMIDADALLKNPHTLQLLVNQDKTIVAPLMNVTASDNYANFWGAMDDDGYYERTKQYFPIKEREIKGCFEVQMVHSVLLINLRDGISGRLAYAPPPQNYHGPYDDIIVFAHSAKFNGVKMHILNTEFFGYVPLPMEAHNTVNEEAEQFIHIKTESIVEDATLQRIDYLYPPPLVRKKDKLGFDQVYMINLKRRPDRYDKMVRCFEELGIDFKYVEAVDGKLLNDSYMESLKIRMLPGYADPYHGRPLTKGEIGCFLSHYFIWLDVMEKGYEKVVVFEDDIRFEPYFRRRLGYIMDEVRYLKVDWDLIYLGRKKLKWQDESFVDGTERLVYPHYSYWTLSYLLTRGGVDKLLSHNPLSRLLPIDEYIPILFDRHIEDLWKNQFSPRDLIGLSVEPLLVFPTRYTGEPGYITDTDNSEVLPFADDGELGSGEEAEELKKIAKPGEGSGRGQRGDIEDLPTRKDEL